MNEKTFLELLEESLPDKTHPRYQVWKDHELSGVERGNKFITEIKQYTELDGKRILDIGCGTGGISVAFAKAGGNVVGIDSSGTNSLHIKMARERCREENVNVDIVCGDGCKTPFHDNTFDIIVCESVIEHVLDLVELAKEISRILKKDGILHLTAPNKFSLPNIYRDTHYGLFGVVLLPRALAKIYVTKIRKRENEYTVGYIPTYRYLKKIFRNAGMILEDTLMDKKLNEVFNNIDEIENEKYRDIAILLNKLKLIRVIKWLFSLSLLRPSLIFIGKKIE